MSYQNWFQRGRVLQKLQNGGTLAGRRMYRTIPKNTHSEQAVWPVSSSRVQTEFQPGDQSFGLTVPNLATNTLVKLRAATILLAHGHYLVATENKQVNCVHLQRPALCVGHNSEQASSMFGELLSRFDRTGTFVEYGTVEVWPGLEQLNDNKRLRRYTTKVEDRSFEVKSRPVVRLRHPDAPKTVLYFFLYVVPTPSDLWQKLSSSTTQYCWFPQSIADDPKFAGYKPMIYFPHCHLVYGERPYFTARHRMLGDEQGLFQAFRRAYTDDSPSDVTEEDILSLLQTTLDWNFPNGHTTARMERSDSDDDTSEDEHFLEAGPPPEGLSADGGGTLAADLAPRFFDNSFTLSANFLPELRSNQDWEK